MLWLVRGVLRVVLAQSLWSGAVCRLVDTRKHAEVVCIEVSSLSSASLADLVSIKVHSIQRRCQLGIIHYFVVDNHALILLTEAVSELTVLDFDLKSVPAAYHHRTLDL